MPVPGTTLAGRYRLVRRLGAGGMGTVWAAEDQRLRRMVAIKQLHVASEDSSRRFQREAKLGASLRHPNLVTVYDVLVADADVLLIMEHVDGGSLAERLRGGPLEPAEALAVLAPIAAALDHAHGRGVIHRDVKPGNILVGRDGGVRLADLGIATAAESTRITRSGSVLGTPAYIAPEQLQGGTATPAADVYALATVAFEALAGRRAWEGASAMEVVQKVTTAPPPDLRDARPDLPASAAAVLKQAMSREPRRRPPSAGHLVRDLASALAPAAASAEPGAAPRWVGPARPQRAAQRGRGGRRRASAALLAPAALLAGALALAVVLLATGGSDAPPERRAATPAATPARTATATATATPAARSGPAATPRAAVRGFYERAARGDFDGAWALAGPAMRAAFGNSLDRFRRELSSLETIDFGRVRVVDRAGDRAMVEVQTVAHHTDRTDTCSGTLAAVRGTDGGWLVDPSGLRCERDAG
jgi:hypothetical protein